MKWSNLREPEYPTSSTTNYFFHHAHVFLFLFSCLLETVSELLFLPWPGEACVLTPSPSEDREPLREHGCWVCTGSEVDVGR